MSESFLIDHQVHYLTRCHCLADFFELIKRFDLQSFIHIHDPLDMVENFAALGFHGPFLHVNGSLN
jgi:hypothetical protein